MDPLAATLSATLTRARQRLGLTSEDIAQHLAIHTAYYERVEAGETLPSLPMLSQLAELLGVPIAELVGSDEPGDAAAG